MKIQNCRICSSDQLEQFLDLGPQPWCNDFVVEPSVGYGTTYPLQLFYCRSCTTVQISYNVRKEIMYSDHLYLSGVTETMKNHFSSVTEQLVNETGIKSGLVVDIGSNDGTLLTTFSKRGFRTLGIEPCTAIAEIANQRGIETRDRFFDHECGKELREACGPASVVSAANVFYHVEDLHGVVAGVRALLDKDGVFVVQGSYLPDIMEKRAFDVMYHEHLLYYRIETLNRLLKMHGLEVFNVYRSDVHGGSLIAYAGHEGRRQIRKTVDLLIEEENSLGYDRFVTYQRFGNEIKDLGSRITSMVRDLREEGRTIYAFGAPAKGTVLLNYCGLTCEDIPIATEKNSLKVGRYIAGTGIKIVDEAQIEEPDYFLLLSWNFLEEFCKAPEFVSGQRKFIVPIPHPRIVAG